MSHDRPLLLEDIHLPAQAAQFLPLVRRQRFGLTATHTRIGLAQPVAQRLGETP